MIDGLNILSIQVKAPIYSQDHSMNIYQVTDDLTTVLFATGEFSNMVWGIYLPVK